MKRLLTLQILLTALVPSLTLAQVDSLSFQGYLADTSGVGYDTTVTITTKLYKGETEIYSQTHPGTVVNHGVFNLTIGPMDTVAFNSPIDLGVKVGSDPEVDPRIPLQAAAFAFGLRGLYTIPVSRADTVSLNLVGGAQVNSTEGTVIGATIGGGGATVSGSPRPNRVSGDFGTVGGGLSNTVDGYASTVSGGHDNDATVTYGTVCGGGRNVAGAHSATVAGGQGNMASANLAVVGGGYENVASGFSSTVPGGYQNRATASHSFAAGQEARANHEGTFVWDDSKWYSGRDSLVSTGENQFLIRADGGVGIGTNAPLAGLHVQGVEVGVASSHTWGETALIDDSPAVLGLYTDKAGSWGSAIVLAEIDFNVEPFPAFSLRNKWAIVRETHATGDDLAFKFGTSADYTANATKMRIHPSGNVYANGSFIGGGADLAEAVEVLASVDQVNPGDVLVVSTERDRTFEKSEDAYSTRVAGVMATKPAFIMSERGMDEELVDRIPLAITGIVPTKVSGENGPISRGDLLVTSSTPCHAMKADPKELRFGMVLGKALQPFDGNGLGMIEVLVNVK